MGQVLIAGIMFAGLVTVAVFVFALDGPAYAPRLDVQERVDGSSDILYLKHSGGESFYFRDLDLIVSVDGTNNVLTDSEISECLGKSYWEPGDVIAIDIYEKWGICLEDEDCVDVFLVDRNSKKLLQRGTMPMEGMCTPLLELGRWYFFTTVEGDDSGGVNLEHLKDCGLDVEFSPAAPGDDSEDSYLEHYDAENTFYHDMKDNPLDLTFGFKEEDFKRFEYSPHNATILMIYKMQTQPEDEIDLAIAGENMTELNAPDSGSGKWHTYNKTVPVNISSISELNFDLHIVPSGAKEIEIDYLAVYLS